MVCAVFLQAHQHAANADDYLTQGLLIPATEEHKKAADAFQACVDASHDENVSSELFVSRTHPQL